jgi:hypothetical protein
MTPSSPTDYSSPSESDHKAQTTARADANIAAFDQQFKDAGTDNGNATTDATQNLEYKTGSENAEQADSSIAEYDAWVKEQTKSDAWDYNDTQALRQKLDGEQGTLNIGELRGGGTSFLAYSSDQQHDKEKYPTQSAQNHYQGKIGENQAVRERVYQTILPQTDAYLGVNTESHDDKKGSVPPDNRERAFTRAESYFQDHPEAQNIIAARKFEGGAPRSVDAVDMLITRQNIEARQRGEDVIPLYLVSESKTGRSQLSEEQREFSYVPQQADYMSRNPQHEDRRALGSDVLQAIEQEKAMYVIYRMDTNSGDIAYEVKSGLQNQEMQSKE